jgi:hypothetical protein
VPPDANVDPFGNMNAMAQQGVRADAANPESVIVNDGRPVEQVAEGKKLGWVKLAALVVAPLAVGFIVGGISERNNVNNAGIDHAKVLYSDFEAVAKGVADVQNAFDSAKDRGMKPLDKQLVADLDALKFAEFNKANLYQSDYTGIPAGLTAEVFTYYAEVTTLFDMVKRHKDIAKRDLQALAPKPPGASYGIVLRIPSGEKAPPPFAEVVELGLPFCGSDNKPSEQGCGEALPEKFQVRTDPQGGFSNGGLPWANKGEKVAQDSIIAIGDSKVMSNLVGKPDEYLSFVGWNQRQTEILAQLEKVAAMRTGLQQKLTVLAQKGKSFAL